MLLSFILTTTAINPQYLDQWLETIFNQEKENFEIVVIDDSNDDENLKIISKYFKLYPKIIKIITNYKVTGISSSRNLGIKYSQGKYLTILNTTEIPNPKFVETINAIIKKNATIDCIEYCVHYELQPNILFHSSIRTDLNNIYKLKTLQGKSVFALTTPLLSTKVFRKHIINEYNLIFRKDIQFDSLFLYSFLAHADAYIAINDLLMVCKTNSMKQDNTFDLMNQWFHILNYYHNEKLKKQLGKELEYAFIRYALYTFLRLVSVTNNKVLIQKAYEHAKNHVTIRYKNFKKNPYLTTVNKNDNFTIIANKGLSLYFKNYFKQNHIRDDTKFWE